MSDTLSTFDRALMIDQYAGEVDSQFAKASIMRQFFNIRPVRGTDTLVNRRVGKTTLKAINDTNAGTRPDATATGFGAVSVTVDTIILARDKRPLLNEFQTDIDVRMELGKDHGKEIAKFFDEAFIIMAIKGAKASAPSGLNGAIGAGKNVEFAAASDELDPDKLEDYMAQVVVKMQDEDIDTEEMVWLVRPAQYRVLSKNDKLVDKTFSEGNGTFSGMTVGAVAGVPVIATARIPTAAISSHKLSNTANSSAYDLSASEADAVAVLIHPKSLLAGETIPLMSDVYYDKLELSWFIDSYTAFGVSVQRPDVCGSVNKYRA